VVQWHVHASFAAAKETCSLLSVLSAVSFRWNLLGSLGK